MSKNHKFYEMLGKLENILQEPENVKSIIENYLIPVGKVKDALEGAFSRLDQCLETEHPTDCVVTEIWLDEENDQLILKQKDMIRKDVVFETTFTADELFDGKVNEIIKRLEGMVGYSIDGAIRRIRERTQEGEEGGDDSPFDPYRAGG
jgi:hypothetical protein